MKRSITTSALALSAAAALAAAGSSTDDLSGPIESRWGPSALAGIGEPGPMAIQDVTYQSFKDDLRRLTKIGDMRGVTALVKANELFMRDFVVFTAQEMGTNPGPERGEDLKLLKRAWKEVYGTGFVSKLESYYQLMRPEIRKSHAAALERFFALKKKMDEARAADRSDERDRTLIGLADEGMQVAKGFAEMGDHYYAAEMYLLSGMSVNQDALGEEEADFVLALEAYRAFIVHRDAIELDGAPYDNVKANIDYYQSLGAALDPNSAAGLSVGNAIPVASSFIATDELTKIERMNYWADDAALTWQVVALRGVGSSEPIVNVDGGPTVERTSFEAVTIKPVEGEPIEVALSGRPVLVETTLGRGAEARPWSFILRNTSNPEYFFGIAMNMSPTADYLSVYIAPAAAAVFEIDGTEIRVFDDNLDGKYGSDALLYQRFGMREKEYEAVVDSIVVGKEKKARPWSKLIQIDDAWYQLESVSKGKSFKVSPAELNTGTIKLAAKGMDYSSLLLKGLGELEGVVVDIADAKRGVDVPAGKYELLGGTVREDGRSPIKAAVTPPRSGGNVFVKPDEETVVEVGGPFGFDFIAEIDGSEVTVLGESVVPTGVMGERYHQIWNARSQPEIKLRKAGSGRGGKGTKMQLVGDAQTVNDVGQNEAWKPLDQSVENKFGAEVEVMLAEKKHKLFGKMESTWQAARD